MIDFPNPWHEKLERLGLVESRPATPEEAKTFRESRPLDDDSLLLTKLRPSGKDVGGKIRDALVRDGYFLDSFSDLLGYDKAALEPKADAELARAVDDPDFPRGTGRLLLGYLLTAEDCLRKHDPDVG